MENTFARTTDKSNVAATMDNVELSRESTCSLADLVREQRQQRRSLLEGKSSGITAEFGKLELYDGAEKAKTDENGAIAFEHPGTRYKRSTDNKGNSVIDATDYDGTKVHATINKKTGEASGTVTEPGGYPVYEVHGNRVFKKHPITGRSEQVDDEFEKADVLEQFQNGMKRPLA